MSTTKVLYIAEDGTKYTKDTIYLAVYQFMATLNHKLHRQMVSHMISHQVPYRKVEEALYQYILTVCTWEHPSTVLDQIDQAEFEVILEKTKGKKVIM